MQKRMNITVIALLVIAWVGICFLGKLAPQLLPFLVSLVIFVTLVAAWDIWASKRPPKKAKPPKKSKKARVLEQVPVFTEPKTSVESVQLTEAESAPVPTT